MKTVNCSDIELATGVTVSKYRELEKAENQVEIARFIKKRFTERYINSLTVDCKLKSGFTIMAVACLMIEALESYYQGWENTEGKSKKAFCSFFERWSSFQDFRPNSAGFYENIRCGILHQAEVTGGWRIWRKGPLIDDKQKTINATEFLDKLQLVIDQYCKQLETEQWNSEIWQAFRKKMEAVCLNTMCI